MEIDYIATVGDVITLPPAANNYFMFNHDKNTGLFQYLITGIDIKWHSVSIINRSQNLGIIEVTP